jgi:hypothetical protein
MNVDFTLEELRVIEQSISYPDHNFTGAQEALVKIHNTKFTMGQIFRIRTRETEFIAMLCQVEPNAGHFIDLNDGNRIFETKIPLAGGSATLKTVFDTYNNKIKDIVPTGRYDDPNTRN